MVGIEIAVLSLGEVKLIHIKNHESMLATEKCGWKRLLEKGFGVLIVITFRSVWYTQECFVFFRWLCRAVSP